MRLTGVYIVFGESNRRGNYESKDKNLFVDDHAGEMEKIIKKPMYLPTYIKIQIITLLYLGLMYWYQTVPLLVYTHMYLL